MLLRPSIACAQLPPTCCSSAITGRFSVQHVWRRHDWGGVNLHGSLLPRHRGAAPVQWTLLRGDPVAGVSVIHMTPRLDAGPILATASTPVQPDETAAELEPRLAQLGADITLPAIELLADWDGRLPIGTPQDSLLVSRAPRFEKRHGQLDFRLPARYLSRLVQAVQPWPGAYAELRLAPHKQLRVIVRRSRWSEHALEGAPGTVRLLTGEQLPWGADERWKSALAVATGRGSFYILEVQPAGKRTMTAAEFARGHALDEAHFLLPEPPVVPLVDDDEG
ncbi:MAG: hypothetical protein KatS3mg111_4261 [Pirellulaceae bacterium]|nr:MAG: hypothetical protein KatS3mg111_4261 [Pirellulaceae bacterium]